MMNFKRLVDSRPLVILALGRSALLAGDLARIDLSRLSGTPYLLGKPGGCVTGWRELGQERME